MTDETPAAATARPSPRHILDRIGKTSLLPLRRIVPANGTRILLKLESENPTGSATDGFRRAGRSSSTRAGAPACRSRSCAP